MSEQQQVNAANNAPEWAISEKAIHEILFCKAFQERHPMKCINGRFYDIDGLVQDDTIRSEIAGMLTPYYATQISRKVRDVFETMKMVCFSEPLAIVPNEIHLQNGVLKADGTWNAEKQFCVNRLRVCYEPDSPHRPERFLSFLNELLEPEDIQTLQEYLGYCLIPSTKGQTMLFLIGNGGEGKSRFDCVLREIFGDAMIEAIHTYTSFFQFMYYRMLYFLKEMVYTIAEGYSVCLEKRSILWQTQNKCPPATGGFRCSSEQMKKAGS